MEMQDAVAAASASDAGSRRVNAVSPMHVGENKLLPNLLQEVQSAKISEPTMMNENEMKLQQMLDNYQSRVRMQQQEKQTKFLDNNNYLDKRSIGSSSKTASSSSSAMSHSQPCLIALSSDSVKPEYWKEPSAHPSFSLHPQTSDQSDSLKSNGNGAGPSMQLMQTLRDENTMLKQQNETLKRRTQRLQQLELAQERMEEEYATLLHDKEKQDNLERMTHMALETQLQNLVSERDALQEKLEHLSLYQQQQPSMALEQIAKLNAIANDLMTKNKEMQIVIERQRIEIEAQNATLKEQRTHIAMLEKALNNAQEKLAQREKACEEMSAKAERSLHLQKLLTETLDDKQRRDESFATERAKFEMEIAQLKMQLKSDSMGFKKGSGTRQMEVHDEVNTLKKRIYSKDERITQLEKLAAELQQKLHEETEKKKNALGELSEQVAAKMKKLEEEKSDRDRRIAELTEEKEKLGEQLHEERLRDDESRRFSDLDRMEEMRQRIAARRRPRHPPCPGGSMGEHARTPSGSLTSPPSHLTSFEPNYNEYSSLVDLTGRMPPTTLFTPTQSRNFGSASYSLTEPLTTKDRSGSLTPTSTTNLEPQHPPPTHSSTLTTQRDDTVWNV